MSGAHEHPRTGPKSRGGWRHTAAALIGCLAAAYAATGLYMVQSNEQAVVRRCGRGLEAVRTSGLYFGLPYGVDEVSRLKVAEAKRVGVGMNLTDRALGRRGDALEAECLTGDRNLVLVSAVVQYTISDPRAYLFRVADVPALVADVAASELTRLVSRMSADDILTEEREAIRARARDAVQAALDRYEAGVWVKSVSLSGDSVAPPPEVADAFADVSSARGDRERLKNIAKGEANRILAQARGEAQRTAREAEGYAEEVVQKARGEAQRFLREAAELRTSRELTLTRLILETMEEVLPRLNKVVVDAKARRALDLVIEGKE